MELVTTVKCQARVCATLEEDGTLSLKVFGSADYEQDRSTTAEVGGADIPVEQQDAVKAVLRDVLEMAAAVLGARISRAIHISATVAAAQGEI